MNNCEFIRYSRQMLLEEIGISGQKKLLASRVLIIGIGGLGTPASLYLACAGVGTLVLADNDKVHLSNLQRQILLTSSDIGKPKVQVTNSRLKAINPDIEIISIQEQLNGNFLKKEIELADVVLDCTDNIVARQAINSACIALDTPLITASAVGFNGQIMVLTPPWKYGCYHCLWPDKIEPEINCQTIGIIGPVVGIMGTLQALEVIKLLSNIKTIKNELRLFDARSGIWQTICLQRAKNCPVCREKHADYI